MHIAERKDRRDPFGCKVCAPLVVLAAKIRKDMTSNVGNGVLTDPWVLTDLKFY